MYVEIFVKENVSSGMNSRSCATKDFIDISSSLKLKFNSLVPMLVSFSFGVVLENIWPGFILRI